MPVTAPDAPRPASDALVAALADLERHVGTAGWDQPARLFALVRTDDLLAAEPRLATELGLRGSTAGGPADALTAVEQEGFTAGPDLLDDLARVAWPDTVQGCAVSVERSFLPAGLEDELPAGETAAADYVHEHPQRQDVRIVVGADRSGARHGVARVASQPGELLSADDLVPGLALALAHTLS